MVKIVIVRTVNKNESKQKDILVLTVRAAVLISVSESLLQEAYGKSDMTPADLKQLFDSPLYEGHAVSVLHECRTNPSNLPVGPRRRSDGCLQDYIVELCYLRMIESLTAKCFSRRAQHPKKLHPGDEKTPVAQ
eukprot:6473222-Amphidinium_carterae.2